MVQRLFLRRVFVHTSLWLLALALPVGVWAQTLSGLGLAADQIQPMTLPQVLHAAETNFDAALAMRSAQAAKADILAANRAPNPTLSAAMTGIDLQNGNGAGNVWSEKRIEKALGLDWTWERGSKRALRTDASQALHQASVAEWAEARVQQKLLAQAAFFDLYAAQVRLEQIQALAQSAKQLAIGAQKRHQAGDISAQELSRTEIEAMRAASEYESARIDWQRTQLLLKQLLSGGLPTVPQPQNTPNQPASAQTVLWVEALPEGSTRPHKTTNKTGMDDANTAADTPAAQSRSPNNPVAVVPQPVELAALAQQRPDVQATRLRAQGQQHLLRGAESLRSSDVTWGASVSHLPGVSTRLLQLRMQMPFQIGALGAYTYEGEIGRAQAQATQALALYEKTVMQAQLELQRMALETQSAQHRWQAYAGDIVPRAQAVAQQAELAYSKGALSLTDLLDARRTLRTTRLEAIAAQNTALKAQEAWGLRTQAFVPDAMQ